jgi:hypothetical protein
MTRTAGMTHPSQESEPRNPGTYRTEGGGIEVVVDVPESASWVEDQFPDEVAFLRELDVDVLGRAICAEKGPAFEPGIDPFVDDECRMQAKRIAAEYRRLYEGESDV